VATTLIDMKLAIIALCLCAIGGCKHPQHAAPQATNPAQAVAVQPAASSPQARNTDTAAPVASKPVVASSPAKPADASQPSPIVKPFPGVAVDAHDHTVMIQAWTCLDAGYLEQVACGVGSREHESLVVIKAKPSHVHAAMLLAGFEPGSPGKWTYENKTLGTIPPHGERVDVFVKYADPLSPSRMIERPVREWIRDANSDRKFPDEPWIFGGSAIMPNEEFMGPGEHYVADMTGSIIGLVTFGDEVIGFSQVLSDQDAVQAPEWEVDPATVPPLGTEVTLIVRKRSTSP
jgi:hypothetical protein